MADQRFVHVYALILTVMLFFSSAFAEGTEDPVVVRVGSITFTESQVRSALQSDLDLSELAGGVVLTEDEKAEQREATIERFVIAGLIQCKLKDAGKNDFTPEEEKSLKEAARNSYEQYWQGIWQKAQESEEEFTEEQVTEFLEEAGYTTAAFYEEYKATERRYRAIELFCPGLIISEDMIREYYESQFLNPDRERYENNLDLYEEEILAQGNESFWTPAGYRAIKQILLNYPDEVIKSLKSERARYNAAGKKTAAALQDVAIAGITAESWEEMTGPRKAYEEAAAEAQEAYQDYALKRRERTEPLIRSTVESIRSEYEANGDFDALIRKYSADTNTQNLSGGGYPVHPASANWSDEFLAAASALQKPGEISEPVYTDIGIHILYYASDLPAGEHELTDSERETLKESAAWYYQGLELEKLAEEWKQEYKIEIHPELLD